MRESGVIGTLMGELMNEFDEKTSQIKKECEELRLT